MQIDKEILMLHPLEIKALRGIEQEETITAALLSQKLSLVLGQCNQAISWLLGKGMLEETDRKSLLFYEITELGRQQQSQGTPSERILSFLKDKGKATLPEIAQALEVENKDVGSAFGQLAKDGLLSMDDQKNVSPGKNNSSEMLAGVRKLLDLGTEKEAIAESDLSSELQNIMKQISKKRGAAASPFKVNEREEVFFSLGKAGIKAKAQVLAANLTGDEAGSLTKEMLSKGTWKDLHFRAYNIHAPATRVLLGRRNPYTAYLEQVKDKLANLGFEEFDGPLVETEFWNSDALFMPQFHSARDIHDVYNIKEPSHAREIEQPWLDNIAAAHEDGGVTDSRGWQYGFDRNFTRRLILRSQGTVLSAKQLPKAKIPGKYFGILRCFRYDQVDATHGADFYQTEGIILGEHVNLRTLLGVLKMFALEVAGAEEVKYVPGYFPFTEPSVEVHIKHPVLGWFEMGGSGIFRPEVSESLGVKVPVLAWGLGIDRMALINLGINDLRELFSSDIENIRMRRGV